MIKKIKKKNASLDDLARMVAKGFGGVKSDVNTVRSAIKDLKNGQEQIKLRLDNVAYRFELIELQKRVEHLEHTAGIRYR